MPKRYNVSDFSEFFGANVKKRRTSIGMSQGELAKRAGYTGTQNPAATISKIEAGKMEVSIKKASMIADALGVTVEELIPKRNSVSKKESGNEYK